MIVVFSHAHPSVSKGGGEGSAYALYRGLLEMGVDAAFVACVPDKEFSGVHFATQKEYAVPFRPENYDAFSHCTPPQMVEALKEIVDPLRPTALIFHHFLHLGINAVRDLVANYGCPSVLVLHEFLAICQNDGQMVTKPHGKLCMEGKPSACHSCFPTLPFEHFHVRKKMFLRTMEKLTAVVSPSQFLAVRFTQWGVPAEKLVVIENGVLPREHVGRTRIHSGATLPQQSAAAKSTQPIVFGYFGRISRYKGVEMLLDAAEKLTEAGISNIAIRVHGNIAGVETALKDRLENLTSQETMVQYCGPYENSDVLSLMQQCNFVVMTSQWWENSPLVIQEAYAAQRPVLVPNVGGMAEKVKDHVNGLHYEFASIDDLAETMVHAASNTHPFTFPQPPSAVQMAQLYLAEIERRVARPATAKG